MAEVYFIPDILNCPLKAENNSNFQAINENIVIN